MQFAFRQKYRQLGVYLLVASIGSLPLFSQVARSSLTGTVTDPQGHRIPGATVRAIESASGLERGSTTNSDGSYLLDSLPVGIYSVSFSKSGFSEFTGERVEQVVGHTRTLNVQLHLARGRAQHTTVTQPLVQLNQSDAAVGTVIERAQTRELPLNGRNWASLTALTPGAIDTGASNQRTIRFAGHGIDDNNITLDGMRRRSTIRSSATMFGSRFRLNRSVSSRLNRKILVLTRREDSRADKYRRHPVRHQSVPWRRLQLLQKRRDGCPNALRWAIAKPVSSKSIWRERWRPDQAQ